VREEFGVRTFNIQKSGTFCPPKWLFIGGAGAPDGPCMGRRVAPALPGDGLRMHPQTAVADRCWSLTPDGADQTSVPDVRWFGRSAAGGVVWRRFCRSLILRTPSRQRRVASVLPILPQTPPRRRRVASMPSVPVLSDAIRVPLSVGPCSIGCQVHLPPECARFHPATHSAVNTPLSQRTGRGAGGEGFSG
jgi:hypothetical protein